jgi:hypothetical protein
VIAAVVLGLTIGDLYDNPSEATLNTRGVHMLTGTAAALAVVFVHSIVVTYFVGTSRWCKEVTETYRLDAAPLKRSTMLKRRTFPWCVMGMLAVVGIGALGAASDPGTGRANTAAMATYHLMGSLGGIAFIGWTYFVAWQNIAENQLVIQDILGMVARVRRERGLDTDATSEAPQPAVAGQ